METIWEGCVSRLPQVTLLCKAGTLRVDTNYPAFERYQVLGKWVDDLWAQGKLEHTVYAAYSLRCRKGHDARKRDLAAVVHDEAEKRVDEEVKRRKLELATQLRPFKVFAAVTTWEDQYLEVRDRYQTLVLHADSRAGKTTFAESLFENPLVITVEESPFLDLKDFDRNLHDGIVLDNVNTFGQLQKWRAVLQARNVKTKGGQSPTQRYSSFTNVACAVFPAGILWHAEKDDTVEERSVCAAPAACCPSAEAACLRVVTKKRKPC